MKDIIKMQSEAYKTFSNPARLQIIQLLCNEEMSAGELVKETGISKANLSQHMSMLVKNSVVKARKQGNYVYYSLADEKIEEACNLMQEVVINGIKRKSKMIERAM
ncbi:MAG: winged helix-turn-helix transcriptional regulator [Oligoflexia bacterium]|nr:winged helix-turn-helix transcriptional regulator [Oligoflexia bacterium]